MFKLKPKKNQSNQNKGTTASSLTLKLAYTFIFATLIYLDYHHHDTFMAVSVSTITEMQAFLGPFYAKVAVFISEGVFLLPALFLVYKVVNPRSFSENQYYFQLVNLCLVATLVLKGAYERGRPLLIGEEIVPYDCCCDYGMPSGHSSSSMTGFHVIAFSLSFGVTSRNQSLLTRLLQLVCYATAILIGWSRLELGVHSLNQVLYGFLLSGFIIIIWSYKVHKRALRALSIKKTALATGGLFLVFSTLAYFLIVNMNVGSEPSPKWKYWTKCPECNGTFKYEQIKSTAGITCLGSLAIGYFINFNASRAYRYKIHQKSVPLCLKRFCVVVILFVLSRGVFLGAESVFHRLLPKGLYEKAFFNAIMEFVFRNTICVMQSGGLAWVFGSLGLAVEADFYSEWDEFGFDGSTASGETFTMLDASIELDLQL